MSEQHVPSRVANLDARARLDEVNARAGTTLALIEAAPGGEVGAAFVRWPDGHEGVLTQSSDSLAEIEMTVRVLDLARERGIPVPHYDLVLDLADGPAIVQERLPGAPPHRIDRRVIVAMLELNDRFAGLLRDLPQVPAPDLYLTHSGPGFCLHESLERYDDRTRRLLAWIREVGAEPAAVMTGDDLVHLDFHPGNVLFNGNALGGVVDWDGCARGDRRFGLVTLAFDLACGVALSPRYTALAPADIALVTERIDAIPDATLRAWWASMSLRLVDWSIRHHPREIVDFYLDLAATRMDG